jgi:hypothetical protein
MLRVTGRVSGEPGTSDHNGKGAGFPRYRERWKTMLDGQNTEICKYLNSVSFKGTEVDLMGNALSTIILNNAPGAFKLRRALKRLAEFTFHEAQEIETVGDCWILACFTPSYGERSDYVQDMRRVLDMAEGYIASFPKPGKTVKLKRLFHLTKLLSWLYAMRGMKADFAYKLYLCAHILRGYYYKTELIKALNQRGAHPKLLLTFCDVHVCDYFVTEYFNKKKVPTATLQHAVFNHITTGYANSFSASRYFLGISGFGKKEFVRSGADGDRYLVLGSMKYIGKKLNDELIFPGTGRFGVALSGVAFQEQNKLLIDLAGRLAREIGYEVLIRRHPALKAEEYDSLIDGSLMRFDQSESLEGFADRCDFCVMGSTNTFGELIANGHLALRMVSDTDTFDGVDSFKFSDYDGLKRETGAILGDLNGVRKEFDAVRNELRAPGDIRENYRRFFKTAAEGDGQ